MCWGVRVCSGCGQIFVPTLLRMKAKVFRQHALNQQVAGDIP